MPDRSDDIKQLFSHLGLNPGQYHELQEKTRAVAPPPPAVTPPPTPPPYAPPPKAALPPSEPTRVVSASPSPSPASVGPPSVAASAARVLPAAEAPATVRRPADPGWPLIRAAQETPTRVAQVSASTAQPESGGSTRRLIDEISRHRSEGMAERLADGASRRWREPAASAPVSPFASPVSPPPPASVVPPLLAQPRHEPPAAMPEEPVSRLAPDSDLAQTFRRIGQPERPPQKRDARLRFSYSISDDVSRTRKLKEENLEQLFDRLSGEGSRRGPGSTESQ